jgi:S-adenosyl methyltransferase
MPRETEPAAGTQGPPAGERPAVGTDGGQPVLHTSVAHSSRVHDYWLGGKNNFAAHRAAEAARRYNRLARETQRHRSQAEVARFFDGAGAGRARRGAGAGMAAGAGGGVLDPLGHVGRSSPQALSEPRALTSRPVARPALTDARSS